MTRPRPKIGAELLPVLLILACMVGTCVLIIATYRRSSAARKMRVKVPVSVAAVAPPPPPRVEPPPPPSPPPEPSPRPPEEDPTRKILARIGAEEAEQLLEAQAADRKAEALERARQVAEAESRRWRRRETLVRSQVDSLSERARKLEEETDALALERDALARERDATKAVLAKARTRSSYAVLPNKAENGTWRRPIMVECSNGAVKLQPNGPSFTLLDLSAVLGARQSPLVAAVVHEVVRAQAKATPDGAPAVPYVFFIVRPDGIRPYYEARARLEPLGIAFGYELVDQDMELDYPDLDNLDEWDGSAPLQIPLVMTGSNDAPRPSRVSGRDRGDSPDAFVWPGRSQGPPAGGDSPGSGEAPGGQDLSGRGGLPGMAGDRGGGELAGGPEGEPGPRGGFGPGGHDNGVPLGVSSPLAGLPGDQPGREPQGGRGGGSGARGGFGPGGRGGDGPLGGSSPLTGLPGDQDGREIQGGLGDWSGQGGGSGRGVVSPHGPGGDQVGGESRGGNGGGPGRDPKDSADLFVWPTSPPGAPTGTDAFEPGGAPGGPDLSGPGGPLGLGGGARGGLAGVTGPRGGFGMGNREGGTRLGTSPPSAGRSGDGAAAGIGPVPATSANDPATGDRSGGLIALRPDGLPGLEQVSPILGSIGEGTSTLGGNASLGTSSSSENAGQVMSAPDGSRSQGTPPPEGKNGPGTLAPSGNASQGTSTPNDTMGQGTSPPSGNAGQGVPARGGSWATQGDPQAQSGDRPGAMSQTPGVPRWVTGPRSTMAPLEKLAMGRGAFAPSSGEPASPSDGSGQSVGSGGSGRKRVPLGSSSAGGGSISGNPAGDVGLGGSSGQPDHTDDPFNLPRENASALDKKLKIEVPMVIVVSCGPNGVVLHPGGYRISPSALKGKRAILAKELRSIVRLRQQVDPMIRPRPSIDFLVEPGGFDTYREARQQTVISGLDWPVSLQVADTKVLDFFPGGRF